MQFRVQLNLGIEKKENARTEAWLRKLYYQLALQLGFVKEIEDRHFWKIIFFFQEEVKQ